MKQYADRSPRAKLPSRKIRRILIAAAIALVVALLVAIFALGFRVRVDLSGTQSCIVFDADGAHEQKMLPVCGYNGVVNWDSPVMFMAQDDLVKKYAFPTYRFCDDFRVEVKAKGMFVSKESKLIAYQTFLGKAGSLRKVKRFNTDAELGELLPATYLIECCNTVKRGRYTCTESAFFWLTVM